jgi:hypothetical protein
MSSDSPVSTWKCGNCGTQNRFANPTCVLCNNPRPADVAMPSGGSPSRLTQFGGEQDPTTAQQRPPGPQYGPGRPSPYAGSQGAPAPMATAESMPVGLIILCVLEGLSVLSSLYGLIRNATMASNPMPTPMPTGASPMPFNPMAAAGGVGIFFNLIGLALAGFILYGFLRRLNSGRVAAIVQAALNAFGSLLISGFGILAMVGGAAMKSSAPAIPTAPGMGTPTMPATPGLPGGMPGAASAIAMVGGVMLAVGAILLILSIIIVWYLTTDKVKNWLSD